MQENAKFIGESLLSFSEERESAVRRGLVVELFPYIYQAAEGMSARAISRFLADKHGVKVSAVTVAKALAESSRSWNLYFDRIEPFAQVFARGARNMKLMDFLFDTKQFDELSKQWPIEAYKEKWWNLKALGQIKIADEEAVAVLRERWFAIPEEIRKKARPFLKSRLKVAGSGDATPTQGGKKKS